MSAVAAMIAAGALASGAAADPGNGNGCVGGLVSNAAHLWNADDSVKGGFGAQAKFLDVNPGDAIQQAATVICDKH